MTYETDATAEAAWTTPWLEPEQQSVTEEPAINLMDMFMGKPMPESAPNEERLHPCPMLRREFDVAGPVARATLRCTARGIYKAQVNGQDVSEALFAPDFTAYDKLIMFQTYDVTDLVHEGANRWDVTLADGWFAGRIAVPGDSCQFGNRLSFTGELVVELADGSRQVVDTSDAAAWRSGFGKYAWADIQIGEKQDLRREACFEGAAALVEPPAAEVIPQAGPAVVRRERLEAVASWTEGDAIVVDFGQVIAGRCRIECDLAEGQELRLEHAEVLDAEGRFFMNITGRNKDSVDEFVGRGGHEVLEPDFTFHGFRYVRISGWDEAAQGAFDPACIVAFAIRSDLAETGRIRTSDARVNKLLQNTLWSQRGNMLSIPTDCPQRERMGWAGDIQVYAPTGCFFMDLDSFLSRWLDQVMADQADDGQVLDYSPMPNSARGGAIMPGVCSSAGWGDAIVTVPWELYRQYGDVDVLRRCYDAMRRWHDYCVRSAAGEFSEGGEKSGDARYLWDTTFHYGDWMLPSLMAGGPMEGAMATKDIVATCWLAHSSDVFADVCDVLGKKDEASELRAYAGNVRRAFVGAYSKGEGVLSVDFQGAYVLSLAFGMLPAGERQAAADRLAGMVRGNGNRLDTGFLSVPYLLDVLGEYGHEDVAEDVFWQDECPSWLYEVDRGATTIWENWLGIAPDGTVGTFSFNHYAFGCVSDWIVRKVGGLRLREPGWAEFDVAPAFVRGFDSCELEHESAAGTIRVSWSGTESGAREVRVSVPAGAKAHVFLPGADARVVGEGEHVFTC